MRENRQEICDAFCKMLQLTSNAGNPTNNPIVELRFITNERGEFIRPIFADGSGSNGYYDVNVTMDSGTAMIVDIAKQFVREMW